MQATEYQRLIQLAKERASSGFLGLVQRAIQDADKGIGDALTNGKSASEQAGLNATRYFLRQESGAFLRRIDILYRAYLDRAMQTMYIDLRQGMRKLSIDELALIDDEVVNHQIEVGRLTGRMRDANEECIGRLNVIVARMHGNHEARERENPFRPYLLARSLYEAIGEFATDEPKTKALFEHLANALIQHLPAYYAAIREVFESSGVHGEFRAQRSRAAHNQRYFGAPQADTSTISSRVLPGLERMLDAMRDLPTGTAVAPVAGQIEQDASVHDVIRRMLAPSRGFGFSPAGAASRMAPPAIAPASALIAKLSEYQKSSAKAAAEGLPLNEDISLGHNRLSAICEQQNLDAASPAERMTVDVLSLLFEFILEDSLIPQELRGHIASLQVPILKAALLQPDLLHDETHPARRLLNRIGSASIEADKVLADEIGRTVRKVLENFDSDTSVFSQSLKEFETFFASHLRPHDAQTESAIAAVETAERSSVLLTNTTDALCEILLPLNIDKRISDFIIHAWPQVLMRAVLADEDNKLSVDAAASMYRQNLAVLPELVWSIQEKPDPQERSALIRMLPDLVKRLRAALQLIHLPEEESKRILDQLVELHTSILRGVLGNGTKTQLGIDALREQFSHVAVCAQQPTWKRSEPPQARSALIDEISNRRAIPVERNPDECAVAPSTADHQFLEQDCLPGMRVELCGADGVRVPAQLIWISTYRSLYLFKRASGTGFALYTCASLLKGLQEESVVALEYAPLFERAVDGLLSDAENMAAAKT
ncbi:MAG TPA: DUF1631 family protein [Noviherbaspirillum sp.]|nr:DUF1631 family protein [Noviherbaspirillum sp.]